MKTGLERTHSHDNQGKESNASVSISWSILIIVKLISHRKNNVKKDQAESISQIKFSSPNEF